MTRITILFMSWDQYKKHKCVKSEAVSSSKHVDNKDIVSYSYKIILIQIYTTRLQNCIDIKLLQKLQCTTPKNISLKIIRLKNGKKQKFII